MNTFCIAISTNSGRDFSGGEFSNRFVALDEAQIAFDKFGGYVAVWEHENNDEDDCRVIHEIG